jgi:SecD/SecF fusion protein
MPWYLNSLFAQAATANQTTIPWFVHLLVAVGVIAISFFLGSYLGKKLRMPDHSWKIGICLFTLLASVAVLLMGPKIKLGIDLSGGVILVYEVDRTQIKPGETIDSAKMDKLIAAVTRRVNPGGQKEVAIRKYGIEQIEVIVPEVQQEEVERIKRIISTTGNLEFRILANDRNDKPLIEQAMAMPLSQTRLYDSANNLLAWWVPVKPGEEQSLSYPGIARRTRKVGNHETLEILVDNDIYNVTGLYLAKADTGTDPKTGKPCVYFTFTNQGGQLFGELTGTHMPDEASGFSYKLAILLDGQLCSAPGINDRITNQGIITLGSDATMQSAQELVNVLNAGSLPVPLAKQPVSELYSGPTLGNDTIQKSTNAMLIAAILVPLFMLWYYRFCGVVANVALVLNMLMLFAIMLTIKAAFTLTGFAGLALTVGMAVDNNVLVYERLREELERGATLRMAIRNAFSRASATIIDANLTTLIAATVMYILGSDQVKGFAVTLWLGVAISIYTSVFVARVIFDIADKRQWITKVHMLRVIGHTHIDFMGLFRYFIVGTALVTIMAVVVAIHRGKGLFDIDFTGGVSVQALFNKPQETAKVRDLLSNKLEDLAISDVRLGNEPEGLRFVINTSESQMGKVRETLWKVFGDKLAHNSLEFTQPKVIESPAAPQTPPAKPDPKQAEPPKDKQSHVDLPSRTTFAWAGDNDMLLALADEPAAAKPVAKDKPSIGAAPAQSVETPRKSSPRTLAPAESGEKGAGGSVTKPVVGTDPYAGGSQSQIAFAIPLSYQAVTELLATALASPELDLKAIDYQISNESYVEGDNKAYPKWTLKIHLNPEKTKALLTTLEKQVSDSPIFPASSTIGAAVAGNTQRQAIYALVVSWLCMIIYLWVRFQGAAFGIAAVVALIHDVFVMLGAVAVSIYVAPYLGFLMIEPFKINLPIVAAFLTIIGYSVNDTIVVFDRIREIRGKDPNLTRQMVNDSTNQTLSRTLLTSFTVLLVVVVLYLFGGEAVHGFAFALIVGVATGTYSSIYIAAPILLWLIGTDKKKVAA